MKTKKACAFDSLAKNKEYFKDRGVLSKPLVQPMELKKNESFSNCLDNELTINT